jgi:thiol:disulfide interchange protein
VKVDKKMKVWARICWVIIMMVMAGLANAQAIQGVLPVGEAYKLNADISTPNVIKLHWTIAPHYYLYQGQMKVTGGEGVTIGTVQFPDGEKYQDNFFGDVAIYRNSVDVSLPYALAPGKQRLKFSVSYQGCHEIAPKICYPPHIENLDLPVVVGAAASAGSTVVKPDTVGLMAALLLAFAGGLVLNLMPCVLPVLSIKAISLLESAEDARARRSQALSYTFGVLCSFAAIGSVIVALRSAGHVMGWGAQLQQPLIVGVLVCLMVAVGLSMSGVVNFGSSLGNMGQGLASRSGWAGDFFTGVLTVVVASPCIAPFMGTALAYAFVAPIFTALVIFLSLGLGLAFPFLLIGFVPALGRLLPRPGAWMETLKQALAFPMYLTAVWLVWILAHQRGADAVGLSLTAAVLLAMALWLFERSRHRGLTGRVLAVVLVLLAVTPLYFLAQLQPVAVAAATEQGTVRFSPQKLAELRKAGTPVFVDMTADWCITCKANEHQVLDTPAFRELLKRTGTVYMVGDWTNVDPVISAFLEQYHSPGVPLYVMFPKGAATGNVLPNVLTISLMQTALTEAASK